MEQIEIAREVFKILEKEASELLVSFSKERRMDTKFFNNKITKSEISENYSLNAFFVKDKRIVVSSIPINSIREAEKHCKKIIKISRILPKKEDFYGLAKVRTKNYRKIENFDKRIENGEGIEEVDRAISIALNNKGKANGVLVLKTVNSILFTNGKELSSKSTKYYFSFRFIKRDYISAHKATCGALLKNLDVEKVAKEAVELASLSDKVRKIKSGFYYTIFEPLSFSSFASNFGSAASIFDVEAGFSFLKDKLNKKVASQNLSMIDDPLLQNGYNSRAFDDEGVPTMRKEIIKNGILKTFLLNTSYARKYKTKTTANAGLIEPLPFNLIVKGNEEIKKEEMIEETKEGIWVTNNWYTRFNDYLKGDFSTLPRDVIYYIKKGEVAFAVKQLRISDNILRMFNSIDKISREKEQVRWWDSPLPVVSPRVAIRKVKFTSPQ
ncbi:MAG: metallopeptidase TldD-related protein [Candidatus Micrarchaeia archaeon]